MKHTLAILTYLLLNVPPLAAERPNIILILSDDMGYSDIGCYGSEIKTPNLDTLAADGLRFTQFYNTGRCCPTRASLLSGLYPHQAGIGHMMSDRGYDGYRGDLNNRCRTIAEVLRPAGYRSYLSGKWHVTKKVQPRSKADKSNWPLQRGFDRFYGTIHGAGSFFDPNSLTRDNTLISPFADTEYQPKDGPYYYTDAISDHAVRFINDHQARNKKRGDAEQQPFFLYVAYTAAHWPMHALQRDIDKYKGVYDEGFATIRAARFARMKELGVIDPDTELSPAPDEWEDVKIKPWETLNMEVYAAMVDNMDQGIGRIIDSLRETGQLDNTLVLYFQDNGGCAETIGRSTPKHGTSHPDTPAFEPLANDYLQPDMIPKTTRSGHRTLMGEGVMAGPDGTYIAYGRGWANVSDTPFRLYKHYVHEGGIATPLVAHWPAGIPAARNGQLEHQPGHLIDLMATAVDLADAPYPTEVDGQAITPMEGRSLVPALHGKPIQRDALYWEHEGNRAIRRGDWKLVAKGANGPWELYNIANDRAEMNDLATEKPALAKDLADAWQAYAERAHVLPLTPGRNRKFNIKRLTWKLKPGTNLETHKAPYLKDRALTLKALITHDGSDGVILAQGGTTHGIALYIDGNTAFFSTRRNGTLKQLRTQAIPKGDHNLECHLAEDGAARILLNGKETTTGNLGGPQFDQPLDGLQVGRDTGGPVGLYKIPNTYSGTIKSMQIKLIP